MKSNKKLLQCVMMILLLCWAIMPVSASESLSDIIIDHAIFHDTSGRALPQAPSISMYTMRSASDWSYGNQMASENELAMYHALAAVEDMTEYYYASSSSRKGITVTLPNPYVCAGTTSTFQSSTGYKEGQKEWNRATHAFLRDYGDCYWIYYFAVGIGEYTATSGNVVIKGLTFYPMDYYSEIRSEFGITEEALDTAINTVRSVSGRYNRVKAAHDYVRELVTYNSANISAKYGHTITGGLLEKYSHLGVCECYAKLFRLLCVENNIPCILVTGGKNKDVNGNVIADHMWNYVQMDDGNWYLVDVTWDDQSSAEYWYTYFLAGSSSQGFSDIVANDHMPVGCFSSNVTYDSFVIPAIATEAYDSSRSVSVTEILLDAEEISVEVEQSATLAVSGYLPEGTTDGKRVRYTSSNSAVASVNSLGKISANMPGTATITVTSLLYPDVKSTCEVTVFDHEFGEGIVTKEPSCTATGVMTYYCSNDGCSKTKEEIVLITDHTAGAWQVVKEATCEKSGSQEKKCSVCGTLMETGTIPATGHTPGSWITTIKPTGSAAGEKIQKCTVCKTELSNQSIAKTFVKLNVTGTVPLQKKKSTTAIKIASQTSGDTVDKWTSSNKKVAKVNEKTGKITAQKKTGTAKITVTMKSGAKASVKIKVQSGKVKTKKLTVSKKEVALKVKETYTIKAVRTPITTAQKVTFSSSNKKIATVNSKGKITARKAGKATITVKSGSKKVKVKVKVTK